MTANRIEYLKKSLINLSNINHDIIEVIVSDNASNDGTKHFMEVYTSQNEQIKYYSNETNLGPDLNFKNILDKSNGKYTLILSDEPMYSHENIKKDIEGSIDGILTKKNGKIIYSINLLDENNYMKIDFDKFTTVLKNLMENAIIYNDEKNPVVNLEIMELYDHYKVTVKDNGLGIAESEIEKIFDKFYRVDKARTSNVAGTGLGLSIVSDLIKILGGKLVLKSKEGEGSTFTFTMIK